MLGFLGLGLLLALCSGFQDQSVPSSVMYGEKPILRLGPDQPGAPAAPVVTIPAELQEPAWVSALREDIKSAVKRKGFLNAHKDIKSLIDDANQEINHKNGDNNMLRTLGDEQHKKSALKPEPQWEKELKLYIKGLMAQYGQTTISNLVHPVIKSIEKSYDITIHAVDGEILVKWSPKKQRKLYSPARSRQLRQDSRHDEYENRYTPLRNN